MPRQFLTEQRDHLLSSGDAYLSLLHNECLALLTYLTSSFTVQSAITIFTDFMSILCARTGSGSISCEYAHQCLARLLYYHASTSRSFRPALIREHLGEAIKLFRDNTLLLHLYTWNETRFRLDDRVRSIIRDIVLEEKHDTVIGWTFAVWNELHGTPGSGHNVNSVMAVFEDAVASTR
jgi:hypothetical protein